MKAATAAKPTTPSEKVPPGPAASRETSGPRARSPPGSTLSGSLDAISAATTGAAVAKAQTRS